MQQLESLTREQRARIAIPFRLFVAAIQAQRKFDADVAAAIERLARQPAFRERINQILSTKKDTSDAEHCRE
jgi:hypothetical protein